MIYCIEKSEVFFLLGFIVYKSYLLSTFFALRPQYAKQLSNGGALFLWPHLLKNLEVKVCIVTLEYLPEVKLALCRK